MSAPPTRVTELLEAIGAGDDAARDRLFELLYDELRKVAKGQLGARAPRATLQATALVSEAYLRLVGKAALGENRRHFFWAAARAMRDVLVEDARRKAARRRGGDWGRVEIDGLEVGVDTPAEQLLALDEALERIAAENPRRADLVRLRFFAGLSEAETAEMLGISLRTASREWSHARADLAVLMGPLDAR